MYKCDGNLQSLHTTGGHVGWTGLFSVQFHHPVSISDEVKIFTGKLCDEKIALAVGFNGVVQNTFCLSVSCADITHSVIQMCYQGHLQ